MQHYYLCMIKLIKTSGTFNKDGEIAESKQNTSGYDVICVIYFIACILPRPSSPLPPPSPLKPADTKHNIVGGV